MIKRSMIEMSALSSMWWMECVCLAQEIVGLRRDSELGAKVACGGSSSALGYSLAAVAGTFVSDLEKTDISR